MNRNGIASGLCLAMIGWGWVVLPARADDAPATQPAQLTTITLHVQNADAREVVKQLAAQSGVTFESSGPWMWSGQNGSPIALVSLDLDHSPFWQAVAQFCTLAHCTAWDDNAGGLRLQPSYGFQSGTLSGVMDTSGPYSVVAQSIQRSSTANLATGDISHNDCIQLQLYVDPSLRILRYAQPWLDVADDDNGRSMVAQPPPPDGQMMNSFSSSPVHIQATVPLKFGPQPGRALVNLSGEWRVVVPAEIKTMTIDNVSNAVGTTTTVGDYSMTITSCRLQGASGNVGMTVKRKTPPPPNPVAGAISQALFGANSGPDQTDFLMYKLQGGALTLVDADGKSIAANGGGGGGLDQVQWNVSVFPGNQTGWGKPPIKLVWKIATQIRTDTVSFHFKDLTLPQQ